MDMMQLIEPYSDGGARTPQGQVKWLQGKGIPQDKIDQAMLHVYDELERGGTFEDGHALDRHLLEVAQGFHKEDLDASVARLESFFNNFKTKWSDELKAQARPTRWKYLKAVFTGKMA